MKPKHFHAALLSAALFVVGAGPVLADNDTRPVERVEFQSYKQVDELMLKLDYTPESWQAGIRVVPRMYLTTIPKRWRDQTSKEITVQAKKRLFFRALAPLALRSNELILVERKRAQAIVAALRDGTAPSATNRTWLADLAVAYKVVEDPSTDLDDAALNELLLRVDLVPVSLVLSQAAEESGWGTSRFAVEGNALFGQWTWSGKGIDPAQQRSHLGNYKIAAFETPLQSVMAYMRNLNTHRAYKKLRARRADLRRESALLSGWELASTLTSYSERGEAYVDSLHSIMRYNKLQPADEAYLGDGPRILLIPVGTGPE